MKYGIVLLVLIASVFIYQSGEHRSARKVQKEATKVADASGELYEETKEVLVQTGEALYLPEAKKKLEELRAEVK